MDGKKSKKVLKELSAELMRKNKSAWEEASEDLVNNYTSAYTKFINDSKTERKAISFLREYLKTKGFKSLEEYEKEGSIKVGDGVYHVKAGKALVAFRIADKFENGLNMVAAHVDAPRLDLKPQPLVEDSDLALLKTHYYGGIKKYQWLNIPLALYGTVIKEDGSVVEISIGENDGDPVFVISDILPHLDNRKGDFREVFKGKDLNAIVASIPAGFDEGLINPVKLHFLKLINELYGIKEDDFFSAELELVPAFEAKEVGLDRSLIGAYGHDDRVCSYAAITALLDAEKFARSSVVLLMDKEEIGSEGITGSRSSFWLYTIQRVMKLLGVNDVTYETNLLLEKSDMLSGDVAAALNPMFKDALDPDSAARLGHGIAICKYTGVRGKAGTSDATAEFVGKIRKLFIDSNVKFQASMLGEVDRGGGGTVAKFFAEKGVNVIDAGTPLLGMHAPYELASKIDIYETYKAYKAFMEENNA